MADLEKLVAMCRSLREKKAELTTEFEKKKSNIDQAIVMVEEQIRAAMNKAGLKSARTSAGTATLRTTTRYNVTDWEKMFDLALELKDLSFFQRRLSTTRLAQYLDDGNELPDFIRQQNVIDVSITKPTQN